MLNWEASNHRRRRFRRYGVTAKRLLWLVYLVLGIVKRFLDLFG